MDLPKHDTDYLISDAKLVQFREYLSKQKKRDNQSPKKAWNYLFRLCEEVNYEEVEKVVEQSSNKEIKEQQSVQGNTGTFLNIKTHNNYISQEDSDSAWVYAQLNFKK